MRFSYLLVIYNVITQLIIVSLHCNNFNTQSVLKKIVLSLRNEDIFNIKATTALKDHTS